jgi:hypothetical protein
MHFPWLPAFRIADLDQGWGKAPRRAGVYIVSCGRPVQRAGSVDRAGIIYVGKSFCIRDRLWSYWYARHVASGALWDMPELAQVLFGGRVHTQEAVDAVLGESLVWVSTPIPRRRLVPAERAILFAYTLRFGEPPPLNSSLPGRWTVRPPDPHIRWALYGIDPKRLTSRSTGQSLRGST